VIGFGGGVAFDIAQYGGSDRIMLTPDAVGPCAAAYSTTSRRQPQPH
jgi:hypothetical protein